MREHTTHLLKMFGALGGINRVARLQPGTISYSAGLSVPAAVNGPPEVQTLAGGLTPKG